ncbi:MAG: baseplate J/gp47 family protein [Deferribacteraceae bacterium]|jgi:uncharacterized phage protein gp47/JayE|nr:baseplate J/gp47 family protein [Deferribacteraceae bacterium]
MPAKNYDTLLSEVLTDIANTPVQLADGSYTSPSTDKGSMYYVLAASLAGCVWGIYQEREWLLKQMFAVSADTENLERHALNIGLTRKPGETDRELLNRYLIKRRQPAATGNSEQYRLWALSVPGIKDAWVYPQDLGVGTIVIDIIASGESETPSPELLSAVHTVVTDPSIAPAWGGRVFVQAPTFIMADIRITCSTDIPAIISTAVKGYVSKLNMETPLTQQAVALILLGYNIMSPIISFSVGETVLSEITAGKHQIIRPAKVYINGLEYVL